VLYLPFLSSSFFLLLLLLLPPFSFLCIRNVAR
jgi:hypothetical protein